MSAAGLTLVLVPGAFGGLLMYQRRGSGPLSSAEPLDGPGALRQAICATGCRNIILCGSRHVRPVIDAIVGLADVFVVPLPWLRAVPRRNPAARATLAAQLVTAHRARPILQVYGWDQRRFPF